MKSLKKEKLYIHFLIPLLEVRQLVPLHPTCEPVTDIIMLFMIFKCYFPHTFTILQGSFDSLKADESPHTVAPNAGMV